MTTFQASIQTPADTVSEASVTSLPEKRLIGSITLFGERREVFDLSTTPAEPGSDDDVVELLQILANSQLKNAEFRAQTLTLEDRITISESGFHVGDKIHAHTNRLNETDSHRLFTKYNTPSASNQDFTPLPITDHVKDEGLKSLLENHGQRCAEGVSPERQRAIDNNQIDASDAALQVVHQYQAPSHLATVTAHILENEGLNPIPELENVPGQSLIEKYDIYNRYLYQAYTATHVWEEIMRRRKGEAPSPQLPATPPASPIPDPPSSDGSDSEDENTDDPMQPPTQQANGTNTDNQTQQVQSGQRLYELGSAGASTIQPQHSHARSATHQGKSLKKGDSSNQNGVNPFAGSDIERYAAYKKACARS